MRAIGNHQSALPFLVLLSGAVCLSIITLVDASSASLVAGWDTSTLPGGAGDFGPSPFAATTLGTNVAIGEILRGAGVATGGTGAARGWGGVSWQGANAGAAVPGEDFFTVTVKANAGYSMSLDQIDLSYRRSGTGPSNGVLAYSINGGAYSDIATLSYASTSTSGATLPAIALGGISALQNLADSSSVSFRLANYGGTNAGGTWYIYDAAASNVSDFLISGTILPAVVPEPAITTALTIVVGIPILLLAKKRFAK